MLVIAAGEDVILVDAERRRCHGHRAGLAGHHPQRRVGRAARRHRRPRTGCLRGAARKARTVFRILASAEAVGVSWAALDMAVEYAKVREQFGRTIGTFQAVKHHAANMLVNAEQTTAAAWDAARADDLDSAWFPAAVAAVPRDPHADLQRAEQHSAARRHRVHLGARRPPVPAPGPHAGGADGRRRRPAARRRGGPAQRSGARRIVHAAHRGRAVPQPGPRGRRAACGRCPRTSSATSSSTPAIWCRTGRNRGAALPTCSSSWSSRRSSPASSGRTWASPAGWR